MSHAPANVFAATSAPADRINELSLFVLAVTGAIIFIVFGLTIVAVVRFRRRATDDGREPPQVYGSNQLETAWTSADAGRSEGRIRGGRRGIRQARVRDQCFC
ncbi:MAG: cytochrome c oxidase, subunit [bacterium]|nr:cytochrome c oxidase, subunit [bacterium]